MTYQSLEESAQGGRPVFKYLIVQGDDTYYYTSAPYIISDSNGTFLPTPIELRSSVTQTGELAKNGIRIALPRDNTLAQTFLGFSPEVQTTVTVFRAHNSPSVEVSDDAVYWRGRVVAAAPSGDVVELECEDVFTSMARPGLRARYQKGCRHALFSPGCGLNINDWGSLASVVTVDGRTVTIEGGDTSVEADYYVGGVIELTDGSVRYITAQSGSVLTLIQPFPSLESDSTGITVTLYPGCDHSTTDCKNRFDNLNNYGGFPYIPNKNPFRNNVTGSIA